MADHQDNVVPLRSTRVFADDGSDPQPLDDTQRQWMQHTFAGTDIDCAAILTQGQYRQALAYMIQGILAGPHPGENLLAFAMKTVHMTGEQFAKLDGYGPQLCAKALMDMGNGVPGALEKVQRARRILRSGLHPVEPGDS
ncbi:hypothetical protein [Pseudomonas putida]